RAVVCICHDLHAVADVVELPSGDRGVADAERREAFAVGVAIAGGEGVVDPVELSIRDDEVGVGVVLEERSYQPLARNDLAVEEQLALFGDLVGDEKVRVAKADGEEETVPE